MKHSLLKTTSPNAIVVAYVRHSTNEQVHSEGRQVEKIVDYAEMNGMPYPIFFGDAGVSGMLPERQGLSNLWGFVGQHPGCDLILEGFSRASRSPLSAAYFHQKREEFDVILHTVENGIVDDEEEALGAAMSVKDVRNACHLRRDGCSRAVKRGVYVRPMLPFYRKDKDGRLQIDQETGALLTEVAERRANKESLQSLCDYLFSKGVGTKNKTPYSTSHLSRLLLNEVYSGSYEYRPRIFHWEKTAMRHLQRTSARVPDEVLSIIDRLQR